MFGVPETHRLPEDAYTPEWNRRVYASLADSVAVALRAGQSVVADAVFADRRERVAIAALAHAAHVPFVGLWLEAPFEISAARIRD